MNISKVFEKMVVEVKKMVKKIQVFDALLETQNDISNSFEILEKEVHNFKKETGTTISAINKSINGLNKKTELLFNQQTNTNRMISAYVREQLYNIEKIRLECKRENLAHIIEEETLQQQMIWIVCLPWYKKITKKQQCKILVRMQEISDNVRSKYAVQMEQVMTEIHNHTREKFFEKLNSTTNNLKEQKDGE